MLGHKFPVPRLLEGVVVRMVRLLPSLVQGVDDHSGHSLEPARLRRGGFQAISDSKIVISDVYGKGMTNFILRNQQHNNSCTCVVFALD
jgi:hypothetical protein